MGAAFPEAIVDGAVSRDKLKEYIEQSPFALRRIETIVHPLVAQDRAEFLARYPDDIVVLDVPLLFETGANNNMDFVVVVTIDEGTQRNRVMERGTMTTAQFEAILEKQTPDFDKRAGADFIILTTTPSHALLQVQEVLENIREKTNA